MKCADLKIGWNITTAHPANTKLYNDVFSFTRAPIHGCKEEREVDVGKMFGSSASPKTFLIYRRVLSRKFLRVYTNLEMGVRVAGPGVAQRKHGPKLAHLTRQFIEVHPPHGKAALRILPYAQQEN